MQKFDFFNFNPHLHVVTGASKIIHIVCYVYTFVLMFSRSVKLFGYGTFNGIRVVHTIRKVKVKVRQSRYRPGVAQRVPGS